MNNELKAYFFPRASTEKELGSAGGQGWRAVHADSLQYKSSVRLSQPG